VNKLTASAISVCAILVLWALVASFVAKSVPAPSVVAMSLARQWSKHLDRTTATAVEASLGLSISITLSGIAVTAVGMYDKLKDFIYPVIVMFKASPAVAFVPLFIELTGTGIAPKILVAAMISFFPMAIGGIDGLSTTPERLITSCRTFGASPWKVYRHALLGYGLIGFLSGLKTAAPLAVVGAIVGEYVTGGKPTGVGTYIMSNLNNPTGIFEGVVLATMMGLCFFSLAEGAHRYAIQRLHLREQS
jgi:NitT/TauT family transport system permease protein